jgi:hypothetical protein
MSWRVLTIFTDKSKISVGSSLANQDLSHRKLGSEGSDESDFPDAFPGMGMPRLPRFGFCPPLEPKTTVVRKRFGMLCA